MKSPWQRRAYWRAYYEYQRLQRIARWLIAERGFAKTRATRHMETENAHG